jgi:hypothetical protein
MVDRDWAKDLATELGNARAQSEELTFFTSSLSNGFRVDDEMLSKSLDKLSSISKTTQGVLLRMAVTLASPKVADRVRAQIDVPDDQFANVMNGAKNLAEGDLTRLSSAIPKLALAIERRSPDRVEQFDKVRALTRGAHDELARLVATVTAWVNAAGSGGSSSGSSGSSGSSSGSSGSSGGTPPASLECVDCNINGCFAAGGGCNINGCFAPGGGCNINGCFEPGGGCNINGCFKAGGKCTINGCIRGTPKLPSFQCTK